MPGSSSKAPALVEDFAELGARLRLCRRHRSAHDERRRFPRLPARQRGRTPRSIQRPIASSPCCAIGRAAGAICRLRGPCVAKPEPRPCSRRYCSDAKPLFVAGHVRASGPMLSIRHRRRVRRRGRSRSAVMPWLDATAAAAATRRTRSASGQASGSSALQCSSRAHRGAASQRHTPHQSPRVARLVARHHRDRGTWLPPDGRGHAPACKPATARARARHAEAARAGEGCRLKRTGVVALTRYGHDTGCRCNLDQRQDVAPDDRRRRPQLARYNPARPLRLSKDVNN